MIDLTKDDDDNNDTAGIDRASDHGEDNPDDEEDVEVDERDNSVEPFRRSAAPPPSQRDVVSPGGDDDDGDHNPRTITCQGPQTKRRRELSDVAGKGKTGATAESHKRPRLAHEKSVPLANARCNLKS